MTTVCLFGGTGFLGRRLVRRLAAEGATLRIAVRSPDRAHSVLRAADLDRVTVVRADVRDPASVAAAVAGVDAVVNAVSAYVEKPGVTFASVHEQGARTLAQEAAAAGVARLVLVSGIGADPESRSPYIRARGRADIVRMLPVVPLIGGGHTRLQPVYVEDVAEAIARLLADRASAGRTYELAGPGVYTLRELVGFALRLMDKRRLLVPLPFAVAGIQARLFEFLPNPPLTTGQVDLLRVDNLASGALPGFRDLDIRPKPIEDIVPTYIGRKPNLD
jgi:NADH dehydrogenase